MNELSKQRCPHCNAVYEVGLSVCPECGLETQNPQVVSPQVDSSEPVGNLHDSEDDQSVSRNPGASTENTGQDAESTRDGLRAFDQAGLEAAQSDPMASDTYLPSPYQPAVPVEWLDQRLISFGPAEIGFGVGWILICVMLVFYTPGLGILALVLSIPPLIRTGLLLLRRRRLGKDLTNEQKVFLFFGSAVVSTAIIAVVIVCVGVGVFAGCLAGLAIGGMGGNGIAIGVISGGILGLALALLPCMLIIRSRWRRHLER